MTETILMRKRLNETNRGRGDWRDRQEIKNRSLGVCREPSQLLEDSSWTKQEWTTYYVSKLYLAFFQFTFMVKLFNIHRSLRLLFDLLICCQTYRIALCYAYAIGVLSAVSTCAVNGDTC